jgi:riboflavin biosynthesis pyrimidine reductase
MKPQVTCLMASSVDGRTLHSRWRPKEWGADLFERVHDELAGDAWLVGRVTGQEFAKGNPYPVSKATFPREPWFARRDAKAYGVVLDAYGKIGWGRSDIGGDPIVVVLCEGVSDAHLAGLRGEGVSYIFAGKSELDLALALDILNRELDVKRLLLEGGGGANGAILRAGLVDKRMDLTDLTFLLSDARIPVWWTQHPAEHPVLTGWFGGSEDGGDGPPQRAGADRSWGRFARRHLRPRSEATDGESRSGPGDQLGARSSRGRGLFVRDARDARGAGGAFKNRWSGGFLFRRGTLPWAGHGHGRGGVGVRPGDGADPSRIECSFLGPAFRAGVADRIQDIANGSDRLHRRDAGRRILPGDEKGALVGMGIATVPHPAMLLAFADGAGLEQNQPRPSFDRPERGPPLLPVAFCSGHSAPRRFASLRWKWLRRLEHLPIREAADLSPKGGTAQTLLGPPDRIQAFAFHPRLDKFSESAAPLVRGVCDQA